MEAESADTNGTLLGPDVTYHTLASEASGRMAVLLPPTAYVDFVLSAPANALAVRFSIPDAPEGQGIETPLLVLVNGALVANVTLTSHYSWLYGGYPYNKNPADDFPHHFYDEVRVTLPATYASGARVRLQAPPPPSHLRFWRQQPPAAFGGNSAPNATCNASTPGPARRDCGFDGINITGCLAKGCCWAPIDPNPMSFPWCFFPVVPPTPTPPPPPPPTPGNVSITIDLVDFFDVDPAGTPPAGALSVLDKGADPTGVRDSTASIQATIDAAAAAGQAAWVPAGTFLVTAHLAIDNVTLVGAGPWWSLLRGSGVGIFGRGAPGESVNCQVHGLAIVGEVNVRVDADPDVGVGGAFSDSVFANLFIAHQKCGAWLDGPISAVLFTGCVIRDTFADGINLHMGVAQSVVEQNSVRNTGDDGLALWSGGGADVGNVLRHNTVQLPMLANGIALYGGTNNSVVSNVVADTVTEGGGLHLGNRFGAVAAAGAATFADNLVLRAGCTAPDFPNGVGALWFFADDEALAADINVTGNELVDSPYAAVLFLGSATAGVAIDGLNVTGCGTFAFQLQSAGAAVAVDVVATGVGYAGIYQCGTAFNLSVGEGNIGWNTSTCSFPPPPRPL